MKKVFKWLVLAVIATNLSAADLQKTMIKLEDGSKTQVLVAVPTSSQSKTRMRSEEGFPVVVLFGSSHGGISEIESDYKRNWTIATGRGYVVVGIPTIKGVSFDAKNIKIVPELLKILSEKIPMDLVRVIAVGSSNGGNAAFEFAGTYSKMTGAVVAIPGSVGSSYKNLKEIPCFVRWGARDSKDWKEGMEAVVDRLEKFGVQVNARMLPNQGHLPKVDSKEMFEWLDEKILPPQQQKEVHP